MAVAANGSPVGWGTLRCNRKKQARHSGREGRNQYPDRQKRENTIPHMAKEESRSRKT